MRNVWLNSQEVIEEFKQQNSGRSVTTLKPEIMEINPQDIVALSLNAEKVAGNAYKIDRIKLSIKENGWTNKLQDVISFELLMLPDGRLIVGGNGNHRAFLSKEMNISTSVKANVHKVVYQDE